MKKKYNIVLFNTNKNGMEREACSQVTDRLRFGVDNRLIETRDRMKCLKFVAEQSRARLL